MKTKSHRITNDAVGNYMRSIPKGVKTIRHEPIMREGRCVASRIVYVLDGEPVVKDIPNKD